MSDRAPPMSASSSASTLVRPNSSSGAEIAKKQPPPASAKPNKDSATKASGQAQTAGASKNDKMSAKELKAARRAAKVAERGGGAEASAPRGPPQPQSAGAHGQKGAQHPRDGANKRPGSSHAAAGNAPATAAMATTSSSAGTKKQHQSAAHDADQFQQTQQRQHPSTSLFGNVSTAKSHSAHISTLVSASYRSNIHPSILRLATQLAEYKLMGADTRAIALLQAMADVIRDYTTPRGEALNRDLLKMVSSQVGHLVEARAMGTSQGVAVRYLKYEISVVSADLTEEEAKEHLLERIDHFIRDRIVYASKIIRTQAGSKIKEGDVVMTFARSSVVEGTLLAAWKRGVRFSVIVIDTRPLLEGKALLSVLLAAGIPCTYGLISSLSSLMSRADLLLLGTSALLANGALYSRAGTATCAMLAKEKGIPVIVCCETYKFSERVQLDSFVQNEAGNPHDLLLPSDEWMDEDPSSTHRTGLLTPEEVRRNPNIAVVNLLYDVTPPRYISAVASEVGLSGPESVGVILRDYKSVLYGV
ncbi:IF-2B-domain-containing protein [Testicularia cyperi]|uniref:Translation initiation factor eIF2B subunit delta n=1 Tax=Testicularia cyperi TaxID=1882483 RepID=A0A317XQ24_9BASI|nr:IF-2B-domain-containing protein [Testicularia cyperi]